MVRTDECWQIVANKGPAENKYNYLFKKGRSFMIAKCASPDCSNAFRYLHEGKLFLIELNAGRSNSRSKMASGKFRAMDYVWLCASCCRDMTVCIDHEGGIRVVRNSDREWTVPNE
jgi:hypothetical protein